MLKRVLTIIITVTTLLASSLQGRAQDAPYKFDIGGGIGMSGYLGDVNQSNMFRRPGVAASALFHYIANARWGIRGQLGVLTLSGNSSDFANVFPGGENYKFSTTAIDLGARFEFNFLPYGIGETYKRLYRWSPFMALGVGCTLSVGGGTHAALSLPMSAGVKYKLRERLNLAAEFTMTKVFGDHVDGELADLYGIKSAFAKNTDWHSAIMVSLTYEFGKRCETCNRID